MGTFQRGYALLTIKSIDEDRRVFSGIATDASMDRVGDIVDPAGAKFSKEIPVLLYHDTRLPVGSATLGRPTSDGIPFTASIPRIDEPGTLQSRVDEAWQSVKARILRGVSIGFKAAEDGIELLKTGGLKFTDFEILELSLVSIPANQHATILSIKSAAAVAPVARSAHKGARPMTKSIAQQIADFESKRAANEARRMEIQQKASDEGRTKEDDEKAEFDKLGTEVKNIDAELVDLREMETSQKNAAVVVDGKTPNTSAISRDRTQVITVKSNLPPGIEFSRMVLCKLASFVSQGSVSPMDVAKSRYPDNPRIQQYFMKGAVPAATTIDAVWAGPLVYADTLASEFLEFLRPDTIIGKFGTGGIPGLRSVPFNVRINGQTSGGTGYWVGQGAPKPLTSFAFNAQTLLWAKVAAIAVITEETARFSSPSAEGLVRDALKGALVERLDIDFVDPTVAAVTGTNPASITNGLVALSSAGTSADNARTDVGVLLRAFLSSNQKVGGLVIIMPNTLALGLSLMRNSLGQKEFPELTINGGTLEGIPVITSEYVANSSGAGNMVIAVNTRYVALADDGQVTVDASKDASLQMLDNPTNNSATATATTMVSMFQTDSIALRAHRFINWAVLKSGAVVYMDDVNWGSVGSPS